MVSNIFDFVGQRASFYWWKWTEGFDVSDFGSYFWIGAGKADKFYWK